MCEASKSDIELLHWFRSKVGFSTWLISRREEGEKFNIWQAWLNLENMYGSPTPDEAVTRLFQKALPYCNAKKLYIALLDILERTNKVRACL